GYFIMNFVSSHQIFSVAMQQSHPSVKHWGDRKRGYLDDIFLLGINYFYISMFVQLCTLPHSG
ncbi:MULTISPECIES: hypothetical protein, partial [unclassified Wolbachia]|uniref:hypothetical protein n=2 Tax=Wolbachia TaxID=953 RepID=UPI0019D466BB